RPSARKNWLSSRTWWRCSSQSSSAKGRRSPTPRLRPFRRTGSEPGAALLPDVQASPVLSADVRFEGFTATDWIRVLSLFRPRRMQGDERNPERPRGGVIAVHSGGRLIKLVHTEVGRLRLDDIARAWPLTSEELAHRHHASWAATLEAGTLEAIMDEFGAR